MENNRNCAKLWKSIKLSKIVQNNHNRAKQSQLCKTVFEWFYKNLWMCVYYSLYSIQRLCAHSSWPWPKGKTRLQNKPQTYFPSLTLKSLKPPSFWRFHELDSPLTGVGLIGYVKSKPLGPGQIISIDVLVGHKGEDWKRRPTSWAEGTLWELWAMWELWASPFWGQT